MRTIGYIRVSTNRQAEVGVSLEAQEAKIRAMATVQGADLVDVIVDGGESAKSLNRPGLQKLLALITAGKVDAVIVAKLDRLTRSVKDLCGLLELFEKRKVALISVAESLDTGPKRKPRPTRMRSVCGVSGFILTAVGLRRGLLEKDSEPSWLTANGRERLAKPGVLKMAVQWRRSPVERPGPSARTDQPDLVWISAKAWDVFAIPAPYGNAMKL